MRSFSLVLFFCSLTGLAQFDGPGGEPGSKSIHKDATSMKAWATGAELERGFMQVNDTALGKPTIGSASSATGAMDGGVVSLGDGGSITLTFANPILNGEGPDFAVFENGFKVGFSYYLELAHVEVSADGVNYVRFPSECLTDSTYQLDNFAYTKPEEIYNLAGKHQAPYGTLFDLEEVGMQSASHIRIIDVVGSVNDSFGSRDSKGRIINDPFPSPFESGGFDLDAVAVVDGLVLKREEQTLQDVSVYPTLAHVYEDIQINAPQGAKVLVTDIQGQIILKSEADRIQLNTSGIYFLSLKYEGRIFTRKIVVH